MQSAISTNLMVDDIERTVDFYSSCLGFKVTFAVDADKQTAFDGSIPPNCVFVVMDHKGCSLMVQRRDSLQDDIPGFDASISLGGSASLYLQLDDVDAIASKLPKDATIIKPMEDSWYGMRELVITDLNGYLMVLATPIAGFEMPA